MKKQHGVITAKSKYALTTKPEVEMVAIPVDDYGNLHSCGHKNRKPGFQSQKCFRCGQVIHFDKNHKSISGTYIPLDWTSGKRHECNETPNLENR